jgi:thiamine biosynthesis lipoprotein
VISSPPAAHVFVEHVMGTVISLHVRDDGPAPAAAVDRAWSWLHEVDARFSTYREDSEIRRLDAGTLTLQDAHPDVRFVLDACRSLHDATGGAFDVRAVAGALDPSAFVKGWALQRAADLLSARGVRDFCLAGGGDVITRGGPWRVGVQHPLDRHAVAAVAGLHDGAVATSGAYERGNHIRDPRTGGIAGGVLSVTVTGPDLGIADALSTAVFAMGSDGPAWTRGLRGYEAMTILEDQTVLSTPGFPTHTDVEAEGEAAR